MNSNSNRLVRIASAGAVVTALLVAQAQAAPPAHPFAMTMYDNGVGAQSMIRGSYESAIATIRSAKSDELPPLTASTNLCVSQVMAGKLGAARDTCDDAVRQALSERASARPWENRSGLARHYVAIAYANRAVLHWLGKDKPRAAADLASAKRLAPDASFVAKNLAALEAADRSAFLRLSESP